MMNSHRLCKKKSMKLPSYHYFGGEEIHFVIDKQNVIVRFLYCKEHFYALDNIIYSKIDELYDVYKPDKLKKKE